MRVISKVQNIKINFKLHIHMETKVKPSADSHSDSGYIISLMLTCLSLASMIQPPCPPLQSSFNLAQFPLYNCYKQSSFKQFSLSRWDLTLTHGLKFVFISVAQSCLTVCDPMDGSTPGFPVHHQLLEFTHSCL